MSTPSILFGYTKPSVKVSENFSPNTNDAIEVRSILLSLLVSIEPIVDIVDVSTIYLECIELNRVRNHMELCLNDLREEFPLRAIDPMVSLANGKRVSITRLICPLDIPFERNELSECLIRRFVSLIPLTTSKSVCTKLNGVWMTNDVSKKEKKNLFLFFYLLFDKTIDLSTQNGFFSLFFAANPECSDCVT